MFKNRRLIKNELDNYYLLHKKTLFSNDEASKLKYKSIWYVYVLLIISVFGINYMAFKYNFFGFKLLISQLIISIIILFSFVLRYVRYYKNRVRIYEAIINKNPDIFKKINRVNTIIFVSYYIVIGILTQLSFIKGTLNPPVEGCSYYDWYGNALYDSKVEGYCPKLNNVEVINDGSTKTLRFGIEHLTYYETYEKYEYKYEDDKMVERTVEIYNLRENMEKLPYDKKLLYTNKIKNYLQNKVREEPIWRRHYSITGFGYDISKINEIDMTPILVDTLSNTHNENEFMSERTIKLNNEVYEKRTVHSFIDEDSNINITYTSLLDGKDVVTLENNTQQNESEYKSYYYTTSFHDETKEVSIRIRGVYDNTEKKVLNNTYNILDEINLINVDEIDLLMINQYSYDNTIYSFKFYNDTNQYRIDHYAKESGEEKLLYRNILSDEDFGFKVIHYSYKRMGDLNLTNIHIPYPSLGNSIAFERVYFDNTCYKGYYEDIKVLKIKDIKYSVKYNYDLVNRYEHKCNVELFYQNNPVLLNY